MEDDEGWTSTQLDILDDLNQGSARLLTAHLLQGSPVCKELREHIDAKILNEGYTFKFARKRTSVGRPTSQSMSLARDLDAYWAKALLTNEFNMSAGDAEHHIAEVFASNFTYTTQSIRRAKNLVESLFRDGITVELPSLAEFTEKYPALFSDLTKR